ncbi:MAG: UDP-3-O-(3-hydroxymyristoyl)glucosamine N-acyltransferase, partial [Armatimonadota bacterium]
MELTVAELARLVGGRVEGSTEAVISGVRSVEDAREGDVVLAENAHFFRKAAESRAACVVTGPDVGEAVPGKSVIRVADPAEALIRILEYFRPAEPLPPPGVAASAVVEEGARLGERVAVGANCFIGEGASIGDDCVLFPGVYIGAEVTIGPHSRIYPGVTIYPRCTIGSRVILHAGVVIGADGFGYRRGEKGIVKIPQIGTVEIGDDVEIGANSTVDRAKFGATIIGSGSKIDNLVHIAHNVRIGRHCVIVALSGVAGSVEIGDNVTLAAQTGVKDNVRIGDGCVVAARSGVIGDVKKGSIVSGFPARDHAVEKRAQAMWVRLPELMERLRALEREVERLNTQHQG